MSRSHVFTLVGSLALVLGLSGCGEPTTSTPSTSSAPPPSAPETASSTTPETPTEPSTGMEVKEGGKEAGSAKPVTVVMQTSKGEITLELDPGHAPVTVKNFVNYAKKGFYNGTIFHRVISTFMIQGGGFKPDMTEKDTEAPITNEGGNGLTNDRGTIAMARTSDPNSATSQFFISVKNNEMLNRDTSQDGYGYAVFGKVTKGMDVVDKIKDVPTTVKMTPQGPMQDVPSADVVIKSVTVKE